MAIVGHTKILDKKHTGRLRAHKHTSYGSLILILMLIGATLLFVSHSASADDESYQVHTEEVGAVVPSVIPTAAPSITSPANNQVFASITPITVQGRCVSNDVIEVFKNEVMAGSATCKDGSYSISIELFVGSDSLTAKAFNDDGISGPESTPINVRLEPTGSALGSTSEYNQSGAPANQFTISAESYYRGGSSGRTINWPLIITGGTAPYIVDVGWGDRQTSTLLEDTAGSFVISHDYSHSAGKKGTYPITVKASDQAGSLSYLQLLADISGTKLPGAASLFGQDFSSSGIMRLAWELFAAAIIVVIIFWVGEKRGSRDRRQRHLA